MDNLGATRRDLGCLGCHLQVTWSHHSFGMCLWDERMAVVSLAVKVSPQTTELHADNAIVLCLKACPSPPLSSVPFRLCPLGPYPLATSLPHARLLARSCDFDVCPARLQPSSSSPPCRTTPCHPARRSSSCLLWVYERRLYGSSSPSE